ncbi:DNA polymerase III subunit gamma/tau [Chlamydia sp. 17-3921]|uniref:DNA polymerase III subunit gamma/tau n=1 Tax=Chlamydia sp. 17-3921 TaxID=2675798 RepID=UPI001918C1D0|nr:DNA polymerase III subunit gamma/tau [Chlamydia sp. 17-3921]
MTYTPYQVSSRKYRPQTFVEILGQDSIVTVLKNALLLKRSAHAYIFSGIRGTGKTTLARIFAKALNCSKLDSQGEPCNICSSCREITSGSSLDVIEIDGASHRGIEDIRQINETMVFAPAKSSCKIYIIDEVHMLTKEAFNALLKTLEEPPQHVKFFLATTEIHKIPNTILSRCQKMHLKRIPDTIIVKKLFTMAKDHALTISEEALLPIARSAQGSLRDAESLFDYVIALLPNEITPQTVADALGIASFDTLQALDIAIRTGNYLKALQPITLLINSGVAPITFLHDLTLFYRDLLLSQNQPNTSFKDQTTIQYDSEQLLEVIDFLGESAKHIQHTIFEKTFLETVIIHLIRIFHRPSLSKLISTIQDTQRLTCQEADTSKNTSPSSSLFSENHYQEQSFLSHPTAEILPQQEMKESKPEKKTPSILESAKIDTLLQFSAVEFSGILTKE